MMDTMKVNTGQTKWAWLDFDNMMLPASCQITEWANGEGFHCSISNDNGKDERFFELTWDEWTALRRCVKGLDK